MIKFQLLTVVAAVAVVALSLEAKGDVYPLSRHLDHGMGTLVAVGTLGEAGSNRMGPRRAATERYPAGAMDWQFQFIIETVVYKAAASAPPEWRDNVPDPKMLENVKAGSSIAVECEGRPWSANIVPFKSGQRCLLVLSPRDAKSNEWQLNAIGVATGTHFATTTKLQEAKRMITTSVFEELKLRGTEEHEWAVLAAAAGCMTEQDVPELKTLLKDAKGWIRHAVIGGLLIAQPNDEHAKLAEEDAKSFCQAAPPDAETELMKQREPAYERYFDCFPYLSMGMPMDIGKSRRYWLPMIRVIATQANVPPRDRYFRGIERLCEFGEEADALILYDYGQRPPPRGGRTYGNKEQLQHAILRCLKVPIDRKKPLDPQVKAAIDQYKAKPKPK